MDDDYLPHYERIALDIARRIADGEIPEGTRLHGRSLLSSEYHASPETVRKAIRLLAGMKVVEVREKSGSVVLSADNASLFLAGRHPGNSFSEVRKKLAHLINEHAALGREILRMCTQIADLQQQTDQMEEPVLSYETVVPENSDKAGQNIGSLRFWQATGATIVEIRRGRALIVSPGPYAELCPGDVLIFVGEPASVSRVNRFLQAHSRA